MFNQQAIHFEGDPVICCVCNKPVERYESWYDEWHRIYYIIFYCHGEEDRHEVPQDWIMKCTNPVNRGEAQFSVKAFMKDAPKLPNPVKKIESEDSSRDK